MALQAIDVNGSAKMKALKDKHAALEERIQQALKSPSTASADFYLKQLKKQKLTLKDTIERMGKTSANH
ncbi:MAG: YdcH family protein [Alphaproteobacteria bacterium]